MNNILTLNYYNLKRFWTVKKIIIFMVFFVLLSSLLLIPKFMNIPLAENSLVAKVQFPNVLSAYLSLVVPIFVILFTGGIISNDIRSYFFRTVVSRPVFKYEYLSSKYLFSSINLIISMIFYGVLPALIFLFSIDMSIEYNIINSLLIFLLYFLEGLLFISISITLSMFLKGFFNVFAFGIWVFLEAIVNNQLVQFFIDYNPILSIASDFFFPSGFSEASKLLVNPSMLLFESLLWGAASLLLFMGISYYFITIIKVDENGD